ncbi:histone-like nucleoid-structuring protein Lsr2 [Prescottella equi]|uniref:Putative lysyl tRNA synthetase like protein Lsr2 n=1 Tax=Rhodococcus hoagii TaxID=43767 RepID=B4F352_RHOHA|nr:Lsr2 family protein [Prescottella equi]ARX59581.1 lsr2 putative lysyl tRNA synthetase like protein [Prescottella equi]ARX60541.1 lsr2 putative lysyl tRNA synthetase like protein [Prescottella equi]ARX60646.1 putative lysyl tRNA synthetase like protein [Prescottella equi]QDP08263.1 Lsr2 family protein [Prescottella equi]CAQ30324.1 putative lysyl tRNA synthetase like protein Lsr2 [Prescottella equi]
MARKVVTLTEFFDDFDGEKIDDGLSETIEFTVQGTSYRMDLRPKNAERFRKDLEKWIAAAVKVGGRASRSKRSGVVPGGSRRSKEGLAAIRNWAARNGYQVSTRGRIAREVVEAYDAAH